MANTEFDATFYINPPSQGDWDAVRYGFMRLNMMMMALKPFTDIIARNDEGIPVQNQDEAVCLTAYYAEVDI